MTSRSGRALIAALLAATTLAAALPTATDPYTFTGVDRIVAVGDVHGGFDELVRVLRAAGVIDAKNRWTGGRTHLVQTGDVLDRGAKSRQVLDLLMQLERSAQKAGGRVHALLGNHEVMNLTGDLRYVSAAEYAAFVDANSPELRDRVYERLADPARRADPDYRRQWEVEHPLGWVEHRLAFAPDGRYGKWLRSHPAVIRIDQYLFVHGGISPAVAALPIDQVNARVQQEIAGSDPVVDGLSVGPDGPLWYRGLAREPEPAIAAHVDRVLQAYGVSHIVDGHTTMPGGIVPRLDGKVILIDVGLGPTYGSRPVCLIVQKGVPSALHRGTLLPLPAAPGADLLGYLKAAAALDPAPSPLLPLIAAGGKLPLPENGAKEPPPAGAP